MSHQHPLRPFLSGRRSIVSGVFFVLLLAFFSILNPTSIPTANAQDTNPLLGTVNGSAFRDFNDNGVRESREPGIPGVLVSGLDDTGATATATTGSNGAYTLPGLTGIVRIEFSLPTDGSLDYLQPAAAGGTTVQFTNVSSTGTAKIDVGFFNPRDYTGANPRISTTIFRRGDNTGDINPTVQDYAYSAAGIFGAVATHQIANANAVGTTYGLAYQRATDRLYIGSYIRRGASLGSTESTGAIYRATTPTGTPNVALLVDVNGVNSINTGANPHPKSTTTWTTDGATYALVGKRGLGDLELSEDESTLYATNLNQRSVIVIPFNANLTTVNTAAITQVTVPTPGTCGSTVGLVRPFGLKFYDGQLYVGAVCTAETNNTTGSLRAYIFQFNPDTNTFVTTPVLTFPLTYPRRHINDGWGSVATDTADGEWRPWSDTWRPAGCYGCPANLWGFPQPILTDIEFDAEGYMYIGLRDRLADQAFSQLDPSPSGGATNYQTRQGGDLLLACLVSGTWTLENAGVCNARTTSDSNSTTTTGANYGSGPGNREFFWQEQYTLSFNPDYHRELGMGSLALSRGTGEVVGTIYDTFETFESGTTAMNITNGVRTRSVQLYPSGAEFGKAGGIGDTEILGSPAPIEIGDRVWRDSNGDGIQGASSDGLEGVTVQLYSGTTLIGTVVTDLSGQYLFSSDTTRTDRTGADYGVTGMVPGAVLQIRIVPTVAQNANAVSGMSLSPNDVNSGPNSDIRDTDAILSGGNYVINLTLGSAGFNNHTYDYGFAPLGSIGNRVWIDEDSNGIEDEGEEGVPNVTVQLKNAAGTVIATTVTGRNGYYIFKNLPQGTYFVQVLGTSVPTGMTQTTLFPVPNGDETNQNQTGTGYQIVLAAGDDNLTADFGYNYAPTGDVNGGTGLGTIGNCIWIDADGDGAHDRNEAGVASLSVQLITAGADNLFGTSDDVVAATTTTNATGCYIFDDLTPGAYIVRIPTPPTGYTQTGDPDHYGTATGVNDNQTTVPLVLGPGDVFLDADFGYQPTAGNFGSIGNTIWLDIDADGCGPNPGNGDGASGNCTTPDSTEFFVAEVTVVLIRDLNANGVWDTGEPIIASDITNALGQYNFPGLPITDGTGTDDYLVLVTDAFNALHGLAPTYDQNGVGTPNISSVLNLATTPITNQDFGYTADASGQSGVSATLLSLPSRAVGGIGDHVWLDVNGNGVKDAGEPGIEGVNITLVCEGNDGALGTEDDLTTNVTTGDDGIYYFNDLPVIGTSETCTISVSTSTLPGTLTQTFDGDGTGTPNTSTVILTTSGTINLNQDFGYRGTGTIGNLVWLDTNADGFNNGTNGPDGTAGTDDDEPGIANVTVSLYYDQNADGKINNGDIPLGTQTTDANGAYLFSGLSLNDGGNDIRYLVLVSDNGFQLQGYWHTLGAVATNNNSQDEPYAITLTPTTTSNLTADFGYYIRGAAVGNRVWFDANNNGVQDTGERGIGGVVVNLTITYPNASTIVLSTATNALGYYSFANLLQDEDYNRSGVAGQPTFVISVGGSQTALTGYGVTAIDTGSNDLIDGDNPAGVTATVVQGLLTIPLTTTAAGSEPVRASYDFGYVLLGTIGNRVWLDEDSNGYQDEGEPGMANVTVQLKNSANTVIATTVTDSNGNYIFKNVPAGSYFVQVLNSSIPTGITQTIIFPIAGADEANQNQGGNGYAVTLAAGGSNLTADFGYNWNPSTDVNSNTGTGTIGDCVWSDADGDGINDPEESGIAGVSVQLITAGADSLFGTADDVTASTTTTDATGCYIFDGLTPGAYVVRVTPPTGYTQTGDPDHFGTATGTNDNQTTSPILVGPGDVFLDADFGYQPNAGTFGSIGDTIWLDIDADGIGPANTPGGGDTNESYIPNVTVMLIRDTNANGVWDAGEPIIATDITDANGFYLFPGLPITDGTGTDDYLVLVNDAYNTLIGLAPTFDANGIATPNISSVLNLAVAPVLTQDFGYVYNNTGQSGASSTTIPLPGVAEQPGRVGDRVWLDIDGNGVQGANEPGIPGVTVNLACADGTSLSVVTGINGAYLFENIPVSAGGNSCTITVVSSSLPGNVTQTFDADGTGTANASTISLTTANPISLVQDFGYRGTGTIGNLVWRDSNANGVFDGFNGPDGTAGTDDDEIALAGVTLTLWFDRNANGRIDTGDYPLGTQTTDASGAYLFSGLPTNTMAYVVDVTDTAGVLVGYWHSLGTAATNNNSQNDPYPVTLTTGAPNNLTADFGYYVRSAAVGNRVWLDVNSNGLQDTGERGIGGVVVTMAALYPNGATFTLSTVTNAMGYYSFGNLLLDEDYTSSGIAGQPTFTISMVTSQTNLTGLAITTIDVGSNANDLRDSDNPAGVSAIATQGLVTIPLVTTDAATEPVRASYDFGYVLLGTIGNRIWLDEDSNGYQDEGEEGLPNVTVQLKNAAGTVIANTVTDSNGNYIFKNLPAASYFVQVLNSTITSGLTQTTIFPNAGADEANQDQSGNGYAVALAAGGENLTADFGYNWNPTNDVNTNTNTGTIGNCVWSDADGDGINDPEESGIAGVTVTLITAGADGLFGTGDDVTAATTTNAVGCYIFDGLTPGAYVVRVTPPTGYTQTGDPDHFGSATGTNDNQTTTPVIIGPGDVFLDADFGYQPNAGNFGSIGDTIWLDLDGDGIGPANAPGGGDTNEPYIPNVTVVLIRDTNANGVWDAGEAIIATDVTDANGFYLFPGLQITDGTGTDDYIVLVNDAYNALVGLMQTFDANGIATPNISSVLNLAVAPVLNQDFGYVSNNTGQSGSSSTTIPLPGVAEQPGRVGDRVWLDIDGNGVQGANEPGIPGVQVNLVCADGTTLSITTGINGAYLFDNIPVSVSGNSCVVSIVTATLPGNVTQTFDADGTGTANSSTIVLTTANPANLNQDFGYRGTGTIGNLVWRDTNANGVFDGFNGPDGIAGNDDDEIALAGVTLTLWYDRNGNGRIDTGDYPMGTQTTDANGAYLFGGLPTDDGGSNAQYVVDVTDTAGVLLGYWHSLGTAAANNNSQNDPYAVTLTTAATSNLTADFGYYVRGAAVGNRVWNDDNGNGLQDPADGGISGIIVTLTGLYPNGSTFTLNTTTNSEGYYSFGNLLLDEDYASSGSAGQPTFTVSLVTGQTNLTGYTITVTDVGSNGNDLRDSDNPAGVSTVATKGLVTIPLTFTDASTEPVRASYDFGFTSLLDYGDLPTLYNAIRLVNNGARHRINPTVGSRIFLGPTIDADGDGYPSAGADADDAVANPFDQSDDEDGVIKTPGSIWGPGGTGSVTISVGGTGTGFITAWIDWNRDGDFADAQEQLFIDQSIPAGQTQPRTFPIPASAVFNSTPFFMRVRLYDATTGGTASPTGLAAGFGEVEDYALPTTPLSVELNTFEAQCRPTDVLLDWETVAENNLLGFNLFRSTDKNDPNPTQLNGELIPAQAPGGGGASYDWADETVETGNTYYYWLDGVDGQGISTRFGPVDSTYPCAPTAVTLGDIGTTSTSSFPWGALAIGLVLLAGFGAVRRK